MRGLDMWGSLGLWEHALAQSFAEWALATPVFLSSTSYYALCLISKTSRGAEILLEHNWTTVCHSQAEKWPLAFNEVPNPVDTVFASPATSPLKTAATTPVRHIPQTLMYNLPSPSTPQSWVEPRLPQYKAVSQLVRKVCSKLIRVMGLPVDINLNAC